MKTRSAYVSVLLGISAVVAGTVAIAQPSNAESVGSPELEAPPAAEEVISPEAALEQSHRTVDKMEATSDNISRMLRIARDEKDVVKSLCLDDKLNQIDVAVRSASDRMAVIEGAVSSGSTDRLGHDRAVLEALGSRADELAVEANQCIGEENGVVGDTELNVVMDPALPEGDVSTPQTPTIISQPPQASSPTL